MDLTTSTGRQSGSGDTVDRLFEKFAGMYGKHWLDLWAGLPMNTIKAEWRGQLARIPPQALRLALAHIEVNCKFPPTLPELRGLCEQFKPRQTPNLVIADNRREPIPQTFRDVLMKLKK